MIVVETYTEFIFGLIFLSIFSSVTLLPEFQIERRVLRVDKNIHMVGAPGVDRDAVPVGRASADVDRKHGGDIRRHSGRLAQARPGPMQGLPLATNGDDFLLFKGDSLDRTISSGRRDHGEAW